MNRVAFPAARARRMMFAVMTTAVLMISSLVSASPASAAWAYYTGRHYVCANSLSLYNNGLQLTLSQGDIFDIDHFAGTDHAWGWGYHGSRGAYGWVHNGWFC